MVRAACLSEKLTELEHLSALLQLYAEQIFIFQAFQNVVNECLLPFCSQQKSFKSNSPDCGAGSIYFQNLMAAQKDIAAWVMTGYSARPCIWRH